MNFRILCSMAVISLAALFVPIVADAKGHEDIFIDETDDARFYLMYRDWIGGYVDRDKDGIANAVVTTSRSDWPNIIYKVNCKSRKFSRHIGVDDNKWQTANPGSVNDSAVKEICKH